MSEPFLAEIKIVGFNFAPRGYSFCDGQLLPINQNQALYSLLGTTYGGDGRTSFGLPDLRGRVPTHTGSSFTLGRRGGEESHQLTIQESPVHTHLVYGSNSDANEPEPTGNSWAAQQGGTNFGTASTTGYMASESMETVGGSGNHPNMQPYLVLNFVIALQGVFPSRN